MIGYFCFSVWITSLNMIISRSIHVPATKQRILSSKINQLELTYFKPCPQAAYSLSGQWDRFLFNSLDLFNEHFPLSFWSGADAGKMPAQWFSSLGFWFSHSFGPSILIFLPIFPSAQWWVIFFSYSPHMNSVPLITISRIILWNLQCWCQTLGKRFLPSRPDPIYLLWTLTTRWTCPSNTLFCVCFYLILIV